MKAVTNNVVLQAENLELTISDKNLGTLTTNAKDIMALVENALPNYSVENYSEENIEQAKTDKAMLNNASKILNAKRIELEKEWNQPFTEFKDIITQTTNLISEASSKIDLVVKESELKWKQEKKNDIEVYWKSKNFNLVPFQKIFKESWLNKTSKEKTIHSEIDTIIEGIESGLVVLQSVVTDDTDTLKAMFLESLDLTGTVKYANTIRENKEKLQAKEEEQAQNLTVRQADFYETPVEEEAVPAPEEKAIKICEEVIKEAQEDVIYERVFRVVTPKSKMILLGNFMNDNDIHFEKL